MPDTVAVEELSAEAFRNLLEVERMRSDRGGRPLSVVTLRPPVAGDRAAWAAAWAARVRTTDRVVWLKRGWLALVLWDADAAAARQFLRSAGHAADAPENRGRIVLYSHPLPAPAPEAGVDPSAVADRDPAAALPVEALLVRPMPLWKRSIDVVGALAGLTVLSPALLAVYAAVRLTSPGPALFVQPRAGLGGRVFNLYKFRSMVVDAEDRKAEMLAQNEQDGPAFKMEHDPRITPVGRLIRKTSVDELPQLWNVLKGEMSLVGPRPLPVAEAEACRPWQRRRLSVTPGLTCGWQVQDRRMAVPFEEWVRMDLRYARRRTVGGDLSLMVRTVGAILREVRPNKPR
ncbi:sugar transferase [Alienimonas sp. DA493]|uniref:sugar transferase n=1 Tax=Alienimonas sp. DA493 TaxID=3373605 RepID=UPI003753ED7F